MLSPCLLWPHLLAWAMAYLKLAPVLTSLHSIYLPPAVPSPPLSPTHGNDEASHVGSILESVCSTKEISNAAIAKLCEHVKADPQEQQVHVHTEVQDSNAD